ncbi:MAG: CBS domain-containing protein [Candidatus Moranbacteria bacterium]|nr:CBS domain-containing protein [Candidatus Moranbacteria bacterium]
MEVNFDILAGDIMRRDVVSVTPDKGIQFVADALMQHNIHGVPVVDDDQRVVGIITESDFFMKDSTFLHLPSFIDTMQKVLTVEVLNQEDRDTIEKIASAQAKDIMTAGCVTVYEGTRLSDLIEIFATTHYKTLPVIGADNRLIGILTLVDTLKYIFDKK